MSCNMQDQFVLFSKFGDAKSDGKTITLSQADKWLKQAGILDGRRLTVTDTGILFNRHRARAIGYNDFMKFLDELAHEIGVDPTDLKARLVGCGPPGAKVSQPQQKQQ